MELTTPELRDVNAWASATDARRAEVVAGILEALPDFELAYIKTYASSSGDPEPRNPLPIATLRQVSTDVLFNLIPGGAFTMGFTDRQADALRLSLADEDADLSPDDKYVVNSILSEPDSMRPAHQVHVSPFLISRFPLSAGQAAAILDLDPDDEDVPYFADDDEVDLAGFSEEDVDDFLTAAGYRLPGEAEWEYACRAGGDGLFWWGDRIPLDAEWAEDPDDAAEADRYSNRFGLANLGAYPELCADRWHGSYEGAPTDGAAWMDGSEGTERVIRGGAALSYPWQAVGEWLQMLSAIRFTSSVSDLGLAVRPVYPLQDL